MAASADYEDNDDGNVDKIEAVSAGNLAVAATIGTDNFETVVARGIINLNPIVETEGLTTENTTILDGLTYVDDDDSNLYEEDAASESVKVEENDPANNCQMQVVHLETTSSTAATATTTTIVRRLVVANVNAAAATAVNATAATVVFVPARPPTNC